jgi:cell wall-associated NlpC family hydrolase
MGTNHKFTPKGRDLRRASLIALFYALGTVLAVGEPAPTQPAPLAKLLQAGDLIWPKKPNATVPYNSRPGEAEKSDEAQWYREKEEYLATLAKKENPSDDEKQRFSELKRMSYQGFVSYYLDDHAGDRPVPFSGGTVYVGHVAIIDVIDGERWVVEAMVGKNKGVQTVPYGQWIAERKGELFWVARLRDFSPEQRANVVKIAKEQLGKPYNFWNFDLGDTSGFYCSKLAWYAIFTATGIAPDDNKNPKRIIWFSPKQLTTSRHLEFVVNPQDYGGR